MTESILPTERIAKNIILLRKEKIILDLHLAELFEIETRVLKQAVRRNIDRFPDDFMFQLTLEEWNALRFQFETSNTRGGRRYAPYAFTEQGLAMLSGILNSPVAIQVNIAIMRTFVAIRQSIMPLGSNSNMKQIENKIMVLEAVSEETLAALNDLSEDTRKEFDDIYIALSEMADKQKQITKPRRKIGYIQDTEEEKL